MRIFNIYSLSNYQINLAAVFFFLLNLFGWHWLIKVYSFQVQSSTMHHLYTSLYLPPQVKSSFINIYLACTLFHHLLLSPLQKLTHCCPCPWIFSFLSILLNPSTSPVHPWSSLWVCHCFAYYLKAILTIVIMLDYIFSSYLSYNCKFMHFVPLHLIPQLNTNFW